MLTRVQIRKFRKLKEVEIELGESVVLIGPNNSGKTAALQALALWKIGLRQWNAKRLAYWRLMILGFLLLAAGTVASLLKRSTRSQISQVNE